MSTTLPIKVKKGVKTFQVEFDADRFERVAAALGLFGDDFLKSLDAAEKDIKAGRVKTLSSLTDLM